MTDPLIRHALDKVWCAPEQDHQTIIRPTRITPASGALNNVNVMWERFQLPSQGDRYHVFSVGQVFPASINLPAEKNEWINMATAASRQGAIIHIYNKKGQCWPLSLAWMRTMDGNNVVLAIRVNSKLPIDPAQEDVYFRVYSNAYFYSERWINSKPVGANPITVYGGEVGRDVSVTTFNSKLNALVNTGVGAKKLYRNGFLVDSIPYSSLKAGETIEFVYDHSIKRVRNVALGDLQNFTSLRDSKQKYIIHPDEVGDNIEYYDDIDFHLMQSVAPSGGHKKAVYYHRNEVDAVRMLTHNAYAITDQYIAAYIADNPDLFSTTADITVRLYIRHSGWERPLVDEANRIRELYKLPLSDVKDALAGVGSTLTEWRAENLEQSGYVQIMESRTRDLLTEDVADAYGYNAVTRYMSPTYHEPLGSGDQRYVIRPPGMTRCGVFTYNTEGKLVASKSHLSGQHVLTPLPGTPVRTMELIDGKLIDGGDTLFGHTVVETTRSVFETGYRCYASAISGGEPVQDWVDVTGASYITVSSDGKTITWDETELANQGLYPATKIGGNILWYKVPLNEDYPGYVKFSIAANNYWKYPTINDNNVLTDFPIQIPYGRMDIFMDNESLIEGVDYYVDWPEVVVVKKPQRTPAEGLEVWVRCYGFCDSDMNRITPRETGFVIDGMLSSNGVYDVRNDRNIRITLGGALKRRDEVRFAEDDSGPDAPNGKPYAICDVVAPVEHYLDKDTLTFRELDVDMDNRVQNYLTSRIDEESPDLPNVIEGLWELYSPFCAKVLEDLQKGWLGNGELDGSYTTTDIDNWLVDAKPLLDFDPVINSADLDYVAVHAHHMDTVYTLTPEQYVFVERVIDLYLDDKIDLTPFVNVGTG